MAHMNALQAIIDSGASTAVVVEDDIDWDIRLKSQMHDLALGLQAIVQPLHQSGELPLQMSFDDMPTTVAPTSGSPYGDNWDVIWLGYCRMHVETHTPFTNHMVYKKDDPSVPDRSWLDKNGFDGHTLVTKDFPDHTRFYHHTRDPLCSLFYAVTVEAARKIHHQFSEVLLYSPFDVM